MKNKKIEKTAPRDQWPIIDNQKRQAGSKSLDIKFK